VLFVVGQLLFLGSFSKDSRIHKAPARQKALQKPARLLS
jgi:hypothetical protein